MNITDNITCTFCKDSNETISHLFFDCRFVKVIWNQLKAWLMLEFNFNFSCSKTETLFGCLNTSVPINMILLLTKQFIFSCKTNKSILNLEIFKKRFKLYILCEKYNAFQTDRYHQFLKIWHNFSTLWTEQPPSGQV